MAKHSIMTGDVADFVAGMLHGDAEREIGGVCTLWNPRSGHLCFALSAGHVARADADLAGVAVLAPHGAANELGARTGAIIIEVDNPRLSFAQAVNQFFTVSEPLVIDPTAFIHPTACIRGNVAIGHGCVISEGVEIGNGSIIRHHVVLGPRVRLGERCVVGSHSVIGEVGFGLAKVEDGTNLRIPHLGSVWIGDEVEIGALTSIAAGTIEPTRIERGVRLDDHVFIAHNVVLEENVIVIAQAEISGSVRIGRDTWVGPSVSIRDNLHVAANCLLGIGATVVKNIDEAGIYAGSPATLLKKN